MSKNSEPPELSRAVGRDPAEPIPYGRWAQRADRRHGERDGRKRIPSLSEVSALVETSGPRALPTPYLEMLFSRARDMMEHERLWYAAATALMRPQLAQLESQVAAAKAAVEPADAARVAARDELTDADLVARNYAEELHNEAFLKARRVAERKSRMDRAEAEYQQRLTELAAVQEGYAHVKENVESRLNIARMRALRISAYLSARTATYWEGLVLVHRDGRHLAPLLPHLAPRLPTWVLPPEDPPAATTEPDATTKDTTPAATPTAAPSTDVGAEPSQMPAATSDAGGTDDTSPPQDHQQPLPAHR